MVSLKTLGKLVVIFCVVRLSRCRNELNVKRCPDIDVDEVEWKQYDKECQDKNPTYKFHCLQDNTGSITTSRSYCAVPEQCLAGYHSFINGSTAGCRECASELYQTNGKISYEYKHPSCDENWSKPNEGEIECRSGSTTEDRRFKCNWMDSYIPDSNRTECLCFSHNDVCSCYKKPCEDGKERNENYICVTSTNTSTNRPTTTSTIRPTTDTKTPAWVPVTVIVVLIAIVIAVVIVVRIYRWIRKKRNKRPPDSSTLNIDQDDTVEKMISKEQGVKENTANGSEVKASMCCVFQFCVEGQRPQVEDKSHKSQDTQYRNVDVKGDVANIATGDNHSGNLTATMSADRSKDQ